MALQIVFFIKQIIKHRRQLVQLCQGGLFTLLASMFCLYGFLIERLIQKGVNHHKILLPRDGLIASSARTLKNLSGVFADHPPQIVGLTSGKPFSNG